MKTVMKTLMMIPALLVAFSAFSQEGVSNGGGGDMVLVKGKWVLRDQLNVVAGMITTPYRPSGKVLENLNNIIEKFVTMTPQIYQTNTRNAMKALFIEDANYQIVDQLDCELLIYNSVTGFTNPSDLSRERIRRHQNSDLTESIPYACTIGKTTYFGKREFAKLNRAEDKALSLVHERLHSLRPYLAESGQSEFILGPEYSDGSGFKNYEYFPHVSENMHRWILPYVAAVTQTSSSEMNAQFMSSVNARICLSYFKSGCSDIDAYDPGVYAQEKARKSMANYFDQIFRDGLKVSKLRLKSDLEMLGTGNVFARLGEKCFLTGPRSYETSVTLKEGAEFLLQIKSGLLGGGSYFANLQLTDISNSARYEVTCESPPDERSVVQLVQQVRSVFELMP